MSALIVYLAFAGMVVVGTLAVPFWLMTGMRSEYTLIGLSAGLLLLGYGGLALVACFISPWFGGPMILALLFALGSEPT